MQKPLNAVWNFLLKLAFLLGSYVQVQKLYINGNEKVIFTYNEIIIKCIN